MAGGKLPSEWPLVAERIGTDDTVSATDPPTEDDPAVAVDARSQRYQLGIELGRGGMGRVVEAYDTQLGRTVALKEILPRAGANLARRFAREVQLTARLEHPSIVPLYDSGVSIDGRPYYVMRRVSGRPLDELISRARDLGERLKLLPEMLAAIDAIAHAHKRGVIHRDLKPGNILVGELGETVVIDWGLAKVIGESDSLAPDAPQPLPSDSLQTQIGSVFGTPGFMAPEQARGEELGPAGDVYALGACMYQLLSGRAPVSGKSATEVIEKTHRHDIVPLARAAPLAPPDLVAIVEKALAYESEDRYGDASALAEDVRRFLDGQLVAAHQYTRRQRIGRFARRHRAPLAVAALAMFAVAVLAWVGVRRIVRERDIARQARELAIESQREAETARDRERERGEALLVTQARSLLETNPTHAVAILKQLAPTSKRMQEARAIARSAAMRGVAWAMEGPGGLSLPSIDPSGDRLSIMNRIDGRLHVYDLVARKHVRERKFEARTYVGWLADGRMLVAAPGATQLYDATRDTLETLPLPPIDNFEIARDGHRILVTTTEPGATLFDVATRTAKQLPGQTKAAARAIAPDGSWVALGEGATTTIYSADGTELIRHRDRVAGSTVVLLVASREHLAIVVDGRRLYECTIATRACAPVTLLPGNHVIVELHYRGRDLIAALGNRLVVWNGHHARELPIKTFVHPFVEVGDHSLLVARPTDITILAPFGMHTLVLPTGVERLRMAAHASRLAVVGPSSSSILVFELADVVPRSVSQGSDPVVRAVEFADDTTALVHTNRDQGEWRWLDFASARTTPFEDPTEYPAVMLAVDAQSVLLQSISPLGPQLRRVRRGHAGFEKLATMMGQPRSAVSFVGGDVVFHLNEPRVHAKLGDAAPKQLFATDAPIFALTLVGPRHVLALSMKGELVRGNIDTDQYERTQLAGAHVIGRDIANRSLIGAGDRLFVWEQDPVEVARFGRRIQQIAPVEGGAAIVLSDYEVQVIDAVPNARPRRVLDGSARPPQISRDGKRLVGALATGELVVVDLPSFTALRVPRWTDSPLAQFAIAPTMPRVVESIPGGLLLRQLPDGGPDVGAYLARLTNAIVDPDHVVAWPWQLAPSP